MEYARLIQGALQDAPNPIRVGGEDIFTTDPTPYGYKPVLFTDPPEAEGMEPVFDGWEETETAIRQRWRLEPLPDPEADEADYRAALKRLGVDIS